jgi:DNA-binding MarR family transcriptional regulator
LTATRPRSIDLDLADLRRLLAILSRNSRLRTLARAPDELRRVLLISGLGARHVPILFTLALDGPASVGSVARKVGLTPATTSLLIGQLDRAGLVERYGDDTDRRRTIVALAEPYCRDVESWSKVRLVPLRRTLERLGPAGREQFLAGLDVLVEELVAAYERPASR